EAKKWSRFTGDTLGCGGRTVRPSHRHRSIRMSHSGEIFFSSWRKSLELHAKRSKWMLAQKIEHRGFVIERAARGARSSVWPFEVNGRCDRSVALPKRHAVLLFCASTADFHPFDVWVTDVAREIGEPHRHHRAGRQLGVHIDLRCLSAV